MLGARAKRARRREPPNFPYCKKEALLLLLLFCGRSGGASEASKKKTAAAAALQRQKRAASRAVGGRPPEPPLLPARLHWCRRRWGGRQKRAESRAGEGGPPEPPLRPHIRWWRQSWGGALPNSLARTHTCFRLRATVSSASSFSLRRPTVTIMVQTVCERSKEGEGERSE
jgi:hypothetical protein